ncbi:hypothetical protein VTN77DRAFT_7653 [Rasamsonia byssochlamydoides]|uniref:uncharacterized protein n=1 Tax=Rasamsonia byssochlamydoides TaxID=89139 RepID=UPI0037447911
MLSCLTAATVTAFGKKNPVFPVVLIEVDGGRMIPYGKRDQEENLQWATLPLMILKPKLRDASLQLMVRNHDSLVLSAEDAKWIRSGFEDLLATSHETAVTGKLAAVTMMRRRQAVRNSFASIWIIYSSAGMASSPGAFHHSAETVDFIAAWRISVAGREERFQSAEGLYLYKFGG